MATPIKITPVISGKSSARFNKMLLRDARKKVSAEDRSRIKELVKNVLSKNPIPGK